MSEEDVLIIRHRLKNVLDWLLMSFRRIKEHLAETGKEIPEAVVSPDSMIIMNNSTSMNLILYNCLTSCSQKFVPVVVDWLYNFLEDRFEKGHDDLTSVEQDYLRVMLDYVHEKVMRKLRADDGNRWGKEEISEVQVLSTPMDRKNTQTSDLQLTDEEVEWIHSSNNKNSMADTDLKWMTDTEEIELDIPKR